MPRLAVLFGLCLLSIGCTVAGETEKSAEGEVIDVSADSVDVQSVSDQVVSFYFEGVLPVPCYAFHRARVRREGKTVRVRVRARRTANYCVQVIGTLEKDSLDIEVERDGEYTFEFWREEADPLTVSVP